MKAYLLLTLSIVCEVFAVTMLKLSDGFTLLLPALGTIIGYGVSFYSMGVTLKTLPLSFVYAVWSGVGTVLTAIISVLLWDETLTIMKVVGMVLIVGGVLLLNENGNKKKATKPTE